MFFSLSPRVRASRTLTLQVSSADPTKPAPIVVPTVDQIAATANAVDLKDTLAKLTPSLDALRTAVQHFLAVISGPLSHKHLPKQVRESLERVLTRATNAANPAIKGITDAIAAIGHTLDAPTFARVVECFGDVVLVVADFIDSAAITIDTAIQPIVDLLGQLKQKPSAEDAKKYKNQLHRLADSVSDKVEQILTQGYSVKQVPDDGSARQFNQ